MVQHLNWGIEDKEVVVVSSRRGRIEVRARVSDMVADGIVFIHSTLQLSQQIA